MSEKTKFQEFYESPFGNSEDELTIIKEEIRIENRTSSISSILKNEEVKELKLEDHKDFKMSVRDYGNKSSIDYMKSLSEDQKIILLGTVIDNAANYLPNGVNGCKIFLQSFSDELMELKRIINEEDIDYLSESKLKYLK